MRICNIIVTSLCILLFTCFESNSQNIHGALQIGGSDGYSVPRAGVFDVDGDFIISGQFDYNIDFDPGAGTFFMAPKGSADDAFVCKLDPNGIFKWAKSWGGISHDFVGSSAVDSAGNIYTIGAFGGTIDFDPGPDTALLSTNGGWDVYVLKLDKNGNYIWAVNVGGGSEDRGLSLAVDGNGFIYCVGYFEGTADFDPGPNVYSLSVHHARDGYVLKLDTAGNFISVLQFGGPFEDLCYEIKTFNDSCLYVMGTYEVGFDFDPGNDSTILQSAGRSDVFIAKYTLGLDFIWAKSIGGDGTDKGSAMTVDENGNVFTSGNFKSTCDFDPGPGTFNLTNLWGADIFVLKLNSAGVFNWASQFEGQSTSFADDWALAIAVDSSGCVYSTGQYSKAVDVDPGPNTFLLSAGTSDYLQGYLLKLSANGALDWAHSFGDTLGDGGTTLTFDENGKLVTAGVFALTVDFDFGTGVFNLISGGGRDIYILGLGQFVGVGELTRKKVLKVFPNPAAGTFYLMHDTELADIQIRVFDQRGQIQNSSFVMYSNTIELQIFGESGVYLAEIYDEKNKSQYYAKLIKQ